LVDIIQVFLWEFWGLSRFKVVVAIPHIPGRMMSLSLLLTATNRRNQRIEMKFLLCSDLQTVLFHNRLPQNLLVDTCFPLKILPLDKSALEQLSNNRGRQSNIIEDVGNASQALDAVAHLIVSHERHVAPTFRPTMPICRMSSSTSVHLRRGCEEV